MCGSASEVRKISEQLKTVRALADVHAVMGDSESLLIELAADPRSPIKYVESVAEFHLEYDTFDERGRVTRAHLWSYSPFTGRPLPSRRAELFMEPAQEDVRMIKEKLYPARTFAEVEAALGPPDESITGDFLGSGRIAQHVYTNLAPTLRIVVWELDDGGIDFTYYGKRKGE
jgi:hypothetical protein